MNTLIARARDDADTLARDLREALHHASRLEAVVILPLIA